MESIEKKLRKEFGWEIMPESLCIASERTPDPRIVNVTINFKVMKYEINEN